MSNQAAQDLLTRNDVEIDPGFGISDPGLSAYVTAKTHFEDRSDEDRRVAYQREAWCLAAQAVLRQGPYTETRIKAHYAEIMSLAFDRQRLHAVGKAAGNGEFRARTWGPKSVSNYCKTYFSAPNPHPGALLNKVTGGNRTKRLSPAEDMLLDACCRSYLSTAQPSGASIIALVNRRFREVRDERLKAGDGRAFPTPHANTVYRRLKKFTRLERVLGREGFQAAQKEFSPTQHGVRALKPGELIELDFWKGDVFTFSKRAEFWDLLTPDLQKVLKDGKTIGKKAQRQRLWICVALDVATRMPLGMGIAETPNPETVISVLDQVMRDKSDMSRLARCKMPWSQHSGLGTITVDTGGEFFDGKVQGAILAAGGSFIYGRAGVPADKPFVERLFGGFRTLLADELPGKVGYSPLSLPGYDKEGMAAFDTETFRLLLMRYLVDFYPLRPHTGLLGKRPIDAWKDAQKYAVVRPPQPRVRRIATGLKLERMLTKEGIRICGIPFGDAGLFPRHLQNGKVKVEVRVDPYDLREVTMMLDGKRVHLANQRPDLAHHSIRTLMAAIKKMTTVHPRDHAFYEYVLADHADWFANKIRVGVQAHGLPSQEVTAEEINRFENSFCLRLQVLKTPEQLESADMDTLLEGGTGIGIFTAEDIAREKAAAAEPQSADAPDRAPGAASQTSPVRSDFSGSASTIDESPPHEPEDPSRANLAPQNNSAPASKRRFTGKPKGKGRFT